MVSSCSKESLGMWWASPGGRWGAVAADAEERCLGVSWGVKVS